VPNHQRAVHIAFHVNRRGQGRRLRGWPRHWRRGYR
jgi:hypothetical protein